MQKTKLKTFSTLEDAIVELKDYVYATNNPNGKPIRKIYPARYDQPAINNIATQVNKGVPLTDKQQELAIKLVTKYRRQWKKLGIDVSNIDLDTPVKMPIRQDVDREHSVYVEEDRIQLKFPYKPKLIGHIAGHGEFSRGKVFWDKERKVWSISVTPDNVNWVKKFAKDHNFETTQSFNDLCKQVVEAFDFKDICLDLQDKQLILNNVPESMLDWIHKNIGRIEMKNFIKLVSYSYVLDYTLSESVVDYTVRNYPNTYRQILYRQSVINSNVETLRELLLKVKQLDLITLCSTS